MNQMFRSFIILSLFFTLANHAQSAPLFVSFYVPEPNKREALESQLKELIRQEKIEDYIFSNTAYQLFVLTNDGDKNEVLSLLDKAEAFRMEDQSTQAAKKYKEKAADINEEKRLLHYVAIEIVLALDADISEFVAAVNKSNLLSEAFPLCQDAILPTLFYGLLPRGFEHEIKGLEIHSQKELAEPGLRSQYAISEISSRQKIKKALIEFEASTAHLDISKDLLEILGFFDDSLKTFGRNSLLLPQLTDLIIQKLMAFSAMAKKEILISALENIRSAHRPIKTAELYFTVLQSLLLHPGISNLQEKELLSVQQDEETSPRVFTDKALIYFLSKNHSKLGGPPVIFEGNDFSMALEGHLWAYFVFKTPKSYHRSAVLTCEQADRVDVILLDPQNIQTAALKKDNSLGPTFLHIRDALDKLFPPKKKQFLSFNRRRQQDYFNCGVFVLADYEAICASFGEFENLIAKISQSAPIYDSVVPLAEIPQGLLICAQSLDVAEPLLEVLKGEGALKPIYPAKRFNCQKEGSAYIFMKHINFLKELLDSEVTFTEGFVK